MARWVVVIFGAASSGWCDLNVCPVETIGPFTTHDEAAEEAARYPKVFRPHVLLLRAPGDEAPPMAANRDRAWDRRHTGGEYPWQDKLTEEETCE